MQVVLPGEAPQPAQGQDAPALPRLRLSRPPPGLPISLGIAAASGLALSLSLPPAGLGWTAFLAPIPLLWTLRGARPVRGAALGAAFGVAYFGALLSWLLRFGALAWLALVLASAASVAVFGAAAPVVTRRDRPVLSAIGIAAAWTAIEWVRGAWPLGGFAWGQLGSTQTDEGFLLRLAPYGGVWAVSFAVLLVSALLLAAAEWAAAGRVRRGAGIALGAVALVFAPSAIPALIADGAPVRVAALQVDVRRADSPDAAVEDRSVALMNAAEHRLLRSDPPDLAVWGEGALDPEAFADPATMRTVRRAIAAVGMPTLAGAVVDSPAGIERTETVLFDGDGRIAARYAKVHLVPFGEYVPWRHELGWISALRQIPVDRMPGTRIAPMRIAGLPPFGTPICYENSFPAIERSFVRSGAGFLVLTINNASYGWSAAARQHLVMSQLRAAETGRWVVHAAVSGESAFVDPSGRIVARTGLFRDAILRRTIRSSDRITPYVRLGDWVPLVSIVLVLVLVWVPRRRRRLPPPDGLPTRPRTLVVLPTYDERQTIGRLLERLTALPHGVDVVVVDDASPDGTAEVVRDAAARTSRIRLVERPGKAGLASAYWLGFRLGIEEGYDLVVEMDSDLSHDPDDLPPLLADAERNDLVIGSRYVPGGSVTNWSPARRALSRAGNLYARLALGFGLRDATSGFRVYRRRLLEHLVREPIRSDGYGFQIELAFRAWRDGFAVDEAPITFREREHGVSKISRRIVLEALWLVTAWGLRERVRTG